MHKLLTFLQYSEFNIWRRGLAFCQVEDRILKILLWGKNGLQRLHKSEKLHYIKGNHFKFMRKKYLLNFFPFYHTHLSGFRPVLKTFCIRFCSGSISSFPPKAFPLPVPFGKSSSFGKLLTLISVNEAIPSGADTEWSTIVIIIYSFHATLLFSVRHKSFDFLWTVKLNFHKSTKISCFRFVGLGIYSKRGWMAGKRINFHSVSLFCSQSIQCRFSIPSAAD